MITVKDLWLDARALLDEYSDDGSMLPDNDVIDMQMKFIRFVNMGQRELFRIGQYFKSIEITGNLPNVKTVLPDDFLCLSQIIWIASDGSCIETSDYRIEGEKDLYCGVEGNLRVVYKPSPAVVSELTDVLSINDTIASAIAYYGAARLAPFGKKELVNFLENKYRELKAELAIVNPATEQDIIDVMGVRRNSWM